MRELLIGAAVLGAAVVFYLLVKPRKVLAGDMERPMALERARARSEAEMAAAAADAVLSETDQAEVEAFGAFTEAIRSDEYPIVHKVKRRVVRRDIGRRIAAEQRLAAHRRAFEANPLGIDVDLSEMESAVMVPEGFPAWDRLSFTSEWTADEVARVAEYKAGAKS